MGEYFDAVLNDRMLPLFNGTPAETESWLNKRPLWSMKTYQVCVGRTLAVMSIEAYLELRRFEKVLELVKQAMSDQDLTAGEITKQIVQIF